MHIPSVVALWLTFGLIYLLYRREGRAKTNVSRALWIPLTWLLITGSRSFTQWLNLSAGTAIQAPEDGSPLDAAFFFTLIALGCFVLRKRGVNLSTFGRHNRWLLAYFLYTLMSISWSEFPDIAFKRWIKILGHPIMALIVLTDSDPMQAVKMLLKKLAYVLLPLSVCFINYFPQYGRGFDAWTGTAYNAGVTTNKNELGSLCLIFGIFFFWNTLQAFKIENRKTRRNELIVNTGFLALSTWLMTRSSSATSLATMILGMAVIGLVGFRFIDRRYVGWYLLSAIVIFAALEPFLGLYATVVKGLGRNLTLTDRTSVWITVLKMQDNPIFGMGFESFWLGKRLETLWEMYFWHPLQAHNGYIETYLNLGWIGVGLLIGQFVGTFQKIQRDLVRRFEFARLRLAFLLAIVLYNYTEAAFASTCFIWTMFFLIAVDYPMIKAAGRTGPARDLEGRARRMVPSGQPVG
jgi:exopolysaccharide production protein ExoQ